MHMDGGRVPDGRGIHNFILENCKNEYYRKLMLKDRGDMEQITNNENIGYPQLSAVIPPGALIPPAVLIESAALEVVLI